MSSNPPPTYNSAPDSNKADSNKTVVDKTLKCACGRRADKIHCPGCGALTCYATPSRSTSITDPNDPALKIVIMYYRCRRCGGAFSDVERGRCEAPPLASLSVADQRERDKTGDLVEDAVAELQDLGMSEPEARAKTLRDLFQGVKVTAPQPPTSEPESTDKKEGQ